MKYLRRAVKYFIQVSILLGLILGALMLSGMVSKDINVAFQHGWKSVGYIALMFAAVSAVYPLFGYGRRSVPLRGDPSDSWALVDEVFRGRGYVCEEMSGEAAAGNSEAAGKRCFRLASPVARAFRLWEDRITVTPSLGALELEGLSRDLGRLASALEHRFRQEEQQ